MRKYSDEAIETCRRLYCKYGGKNFDGIEREMRKAGWPKWSKVNLEDRGKDASERMGWITRYGFENSLKLHMQKLVESVNDDEQDLYIGIRSFRKVAHQRALAADANRDALYLYRDFCKLEIEARRNLDLSRDNLETFVACYEKLLLWSADLDAECARRLVKIGETLSELAQAHYGKAEAVNDGASDREDEGSE